MPQSKKPEPEVEPLPEGDTFDRAYVEKLRDEAASYRVKLRPFTDAVGDFNDKEVAYLLDMVAALNKDPQAGAVKFRDMAKDILADKFYADLTDIPVAEAEAPEPAEEEAPTEKEDQVSLTPEELTAELDRRDAARAAAEAEARKAADAEEVFAEITRDTGFERGTPGFRTALALGAQLAEETGTAVDFAALAPKIRALHDIPEPVAEGEAPETEAAEGAVQAEDLVVGSGNEHAATAVIGGVAGVTETPKDWVAEAVEAGGDLKAIARERLEARLG